MGLISILSLLYVNRNYGRPEMYFSWEDPFKSENIIRGTLTYTAEQLPIWHAREEETVPYIQSKLVEGEAKIVPIEWKTNLHTFDIEVNKKSIIADRTDYFPGWEVYSNGKIIDILDPKSKQASGLIAFSLEPGKYFIEVKLKETKEEKIANSITLVALFLIPLVVLVYFFRTRKAK